jgi:hypothetical protein
MNLSILTAIRCSLMFLVPSVTYAISAQWDLDPISGDWNTAANWTPNGAPNGPADTAAFALSNTTDVSISANTEVNGITFTSAATNPYTITSAGLKLMISGVGIVNNSGTTQHFQIASTALTGGTLLFSNSATAGSNVSLFLNLGYMAVLEQLHCGQIDHLQRLWRDELSQQLHCWQRDHRHLASFIGFFDNSTAGTASIFVDDISSLQFSNASTAGNASIFAQGSDLIFQGDVVFGDSSTAGNATLEGPGVFSFFGSSRGGTAQIELRHQPVDFLAGVLDISGHNAPGVTFKFGFPENARSLLVLDADYQRECTFRGFSLCDMVDIRIKKSPDYKISALGQVDDKQLFLVEKK